MNATQIRRVIQDTYFYNEEISPNCARFTCYTLKQVVSQFFEYRRRCQGLEARVTALEARLEALEAPARAARDAELRRTFRGPSNEELAS